MSFCVVDVGGDVEDCWTCCGRVLYNTESGCVLMHCALFTCNDSNSRSNSNNSDYME